jgi:hypothetical protein
MKKAIRMRSFQLHCYRCVLTDLNSYFPNNHPCLTAIQKNLTPSPSEISIVCARPAAASKDMAFFKTGIGTSDSGERIEGSVISRKVRIVFSCPVEVACSR